MIKEIQKDNFKKNVLDFYYKLNESTYAWQSKRISFKINYNGIIYDIVFNPRVQSYKYERFYDARDTVNCEPWVNSYFHIDLDDSTLDYYARTILYISNSDGYTEEQIEYKKKDIELIRQLLNMFIEKLNQETQEKKRRELEENKRKQFIKEKITDPLNEMDDESLNEIARYIDALKRDLANGNSIPSKNPDDFDLCSKRNK